MPRPIFDRGDLALLLAIAESGNLIKAAKALRVHHATAFRRLSELEKRTGTLLFERLAQGYVATSATRKLLPSARRLHGDLRELDAKALQLTGTASEPLRVTTSDGLAIAFMPPLLQRFSASHPDIVVNLIVENRVLSIAEREIDVALRPARQVSGDIVCRRVAAMGYSLYASADYVREHGKLAAANLDFRGHAICAYDASIAYFTTAEWLVRHAHAARVVGLCNTLVSMQALARTGSCIAALPCVQGDADPHLVALLPPIAAMETSLWVCTHRRLRSTPRVRAFLDFFYDAVAKEQPRLAGSTPRKR